ncbi:hypothetical protein HPP92_000170 [Vanilla planifolia]|uniref:Pentatricopeptide repeat-containing protein n=1 Tax=Vanilla planifolia TaxID=51239 RepID=A0A835RTY8_VANPL|nr:hypothetical protein HPP92_000170 [Vanilla planifolia]
MADPCAFMAMAATVTSTFHTSFPFSPPPPPPPPPVRSCLKHLCVPNSTTSNGAQSCYVSSSRPPKPIHLVSLAYLSSALVKCAASGSLREGASIHARFIRLGLLSCDNPHLFHQLRLLYSSAGRHLAAAAILLLSPSPILTPFAFNAVIRDLVADYLLENAIYLFVAMLSAGLFPNEFTFPFVLRSSTILHLFSLGQQLHAQIVKSGLLHNVFCATALLDLYTKHAPLADARNLFVRIPTKTEATWNSMISALIEDELVEDALQMLQMMENDGIEVGVSSWNSLLAGCVRGDNTGLALQILGDGLFENGQSKCSHVQYHSSYHP